MSGQGQDQGGNQRSRDDLLRQARERHAQLVALIDRVPAADLTRPSVNDDWSVKDHMAHVTWWEQRVLRVLRGEPDPIDEVPPRQAAGRDAGQGRDDAGEESETESLARINAYVRAQSLDRPVAQVRAAFDASYQEMLRLIETAPDDVLATRYDWIFGNSAGHYDEHIGWIQAWMVREGR